MAGLNEMVAGIDVAIVLEHERVAATWRDDAEVVLPEPAAERHVEGLNEDLPHIAPDPLVEDRAEETAELVRAYGALGDLRPALRIERTPAFGPAPPSVAHQVQLEDQTVCEEVQRGLKSRSYDTGRFSVKREAGGYHFHRMLAQQLAAQSP